MRLRYIVDNPRGPRGGNRDVPTIYKAVPPAQRQAVTRGEDGAVGRVLVADLDDLPATSFSPDEIHQHAERMMLKWTQRTIETHNGTLPSGPLFAGAPTPTSDNLIPLPELNRSDIGQLAHALAVWGAWRGSKRPKPYAEEKLLQDAIVSILSKTGEAAR